MASPSPLPPRSGGTPRRELRPDAAYRASRAAGLPAVPPPAAGVLARALLDAATLVERERLGSALVDTLCRAFRLPPCCLVIADRPQIHRRDEAGRLVERTYGTYRCRFPGGGALPDRCRIRIYHRTAVREQVLGPRAFLQTLLHEWGHHLDFAGLRLDRSPHTQGFYARVARLGELLGVAIGSPPSSGAPDPTPLRGGGSPPE